MPRLLSPLTAVFIGATALLTYRSAAADAASTLSGRWTATSLASKWVEGQWGEHCGAKPGSGGGSGAITISQAGSELTISGGGRTYSTTQCWTTEPGMSVATHAGGARSWKTVCKSAPGAPRQVTITTSLQATDDTISFYETGQYQYMAGSKACTASVGRYRTYRLEQRSGGPPATASAAPSAGRNEAAALNDERCAEPGAVSRIEVTPARRLMSAGDTFAFKATAVDIAGCRIKKKPKWTVEGAGGDITVDDDGNVTVAQGAAETEVDVRATLGQKSATARVEVASKERFEALLARGATEEAAPAPAHSATVASKSLGAEAATAEDRASGRKTLFLGVIGAVAVALGIAGVALLRRGRRSPPSGMDSVRRSSPVAAPPSGPPAASVPHAPPQGSAPEPPAPAPPPAVAPSTPPAYAAPPQAMKKLCPICGRQYPVTSQFCGQDGASLVPMN